MKSKYTAAALAFFLGGLGAHKFYLGKTGKGILYLVFVWTYVPAILGLIEGILYLTKSQSDFDEEYNGGRRTSNLPISTTSSPASFGQLINNNTSMPSQNDFQDATARMAEFNQKRAGMINNTGQTGNN